MQFEDDLYDTHDDSVTYSAFEKLKVRILKLPFFFCFNFYNWFILFYSGIMFSELLYIW